MGTALIYLVVMVLVAAVVFLLASAVFGRGEELAPLPPGASPTRLPAGDVAGDDIRALRFQQVMRGYKMSEVDWVLDRLCTEVDRLRARVAELEEHHPEPHPEPHPQSHPQSHPEPHPAEAGTSDRRDR